MPDSEPACEGARDAFGARPCDAPRASSLTREARAPSHADSLPGAQLCCALRGDLSGRGERLRRRGFDCVSATPARHLRGSKRQAKPHSSLSSKRARTDGRTRLEANGTGAFGRAGLAGHGWPARSAQGCGLSRPARPSVPVQQAPFRLRPSVHRNDSTSTFAAQMKSFSLKPPIAWVEYLTRT